MEKPTEVIDYKGYQIKVMYDSDPMNPRTDWDNHLGTMVCFHRRHSLGDKHGYSDPKTPMFDLAIEADPYVQDRIDYWENGNGWRTLINKLGIDKALEFADKNIKDIIYNAIDKHYIMLPLYLYDHSGITMSTGPFSCPWDSGQIGYIYITKEKARKEYSWKYMTKSRIAKIREYLTGEVETYDQYLTGDVYGYRISNEDDDHIDSC